MVTAGEVFTAHGLEATMVGEAYTVGVTLTGALAGTRLIGMVVSMVTEAIGGITIRIFTAMATTEMATEMESPITEADAIQMVMVVRPTVEAVTMRVRQEVRTLGLKA